MKPFLARHDEHAALISRVLDGLANEDEEQLFDDLYDACEACRTELLADTGLTEGELEAMVSSDASRDRFLAAAGAQPRLQASPEAMEIYAAAMVVLNHVGTDAVPSPSTVGGWEVRTSIDPTPRIASSPTTPSQLEDPPSEP